jgi:hypothetical protein
MVVEWRIAAGLVVCRLLFCQLLVIASLVDARDIFLLV